METFNSKIAIVNGLIWGGAVRAHRLGFKIEELKRHYAIVTICIPVQTFDKLVNEKQKCL